MQNNSSLKTQAPIVAVRIDGKFYPATKDEDKTYRFMRNGSPHIAHPSDDNVTAFRLHAPDRLGRYMIAGGEVATLTHNCSDGDWDGVIGVYKRCFKPSGEHRGGSVECSIIGPAEWFEPGGKYHIADAKKKITEGGVKALAKAYAGSCTIRYLLRTGPTTARTFFVEFKPGQAAKLRGFEQEEDYLILAYTEGWTIVTPKPDKLTPVEAIEAVKDLLGKGKTLGVLEDDLHNIIDRTDMEGE